MSTHQYAKVSVEEVEKAKAWVYEMYRMADCKNANMVSTFLKDEAIMNMTSAPPLKGHAALERLFLWEYGACTRIQHSIQDIRVSECRIVVRLDVTYCFKNGSQKVMKCLAVWYKSPQENRASRVDLDGDFAQVFQELSASAGPPPL